MYRSLILMAVWVGRAFAGWLSTLRRPLASEVAALRERMEKLCAENEFFLRARRRRRIEKGTLEVRFLDEERNLPLFRLRPAA